jgi:lysozyme
MHASDKILKIIEDFEGVKLQSYIDLAGVWTIGAGLTGPDIGPGMQITRAEANAMFKDRIEREFEPGLNRAIGRAATTQNQFDAMLSLAYNIGMGAFLRSHLLTYHRQGDYDAAAAEFGKWCHVKGRVVSGLAHRRDVEADIYATNTYPDE